MKKLISMVAVLALASAVFAIDVAVGARGNLNLNLGSTQFIPEGGTNPKEYYKGSGIKYTEPLVVGVGFAVYANIGLVDIGSAKLGIQPEFNMNFGNGLAAKLSANGDWMKSVETVSTVDIPLVVTISAPINDSVKIGGGIGPYLSAPFGEPKIKMTSSTSSADGSESESEDVKVTYKYNLDFGLALDGNVGFKVGPGFIVADIRYMLDFTPVSLKSMSVGNITTDYKDDTGKLFYRRSLNIGVGYEISF